MSRQFDVFVSPAPMRGIYPHVMILQHDSVDVNGEVIVAPLVPPSSTTPGRLNPRLDLRGRTVVLQTQNLVGGSVNRLKKPIANLSDSRDRIIAAIDMLFVGS